MITKMLSAEASAWIAANRTRLEVESDAWMEGDADSSAAAYPTAALEQMLLAELTECLGPKLIRPFVECLTPPTGWPRLETPECSS